MVVQNPVNTINSANDILLPLNTPGHHRAPKTHALIMSTWKHQKAGSANAIDLLALPIELIQQIATHIPVSGLVALKLTSRQLFFQLPSPPQGYIKTASDCEKRAFRRYVAERRDGSGGRRKCILCNGMMPLEFYGGRAEPVCKWHDGWFERIIFVAALPKRYGDATLVRQRRSRTLCGHCKEIRGWDVEKCPCESSGGCDSCGSWEVECRVKLVEAVG